MKKYYLPVDDLAKLAFLKNYATNLANFSAELGISAEVVAQTKADAVNFEAALNSVENFKKYSQSVTAYKNQLRNGSETISASLPALPVLPTFTSPVLGNIFGRLTMQVRNIKSNPKATDSILKDLGVFGAEAAAVDNNTVKPTIEVVLQAGKPNIIWKKSGHQGVHIYVDRGDGKGYGTMPYTDTKPDFLDEYPLPAAGQTAIWKYKAYYIEDDVEIGQESNELIVTVTGKLS
jgi:hypothetical protein